MIELDNMEWDYFNTIKKRVLKELIDELNSFDIPADWRPKEALGFVIRKLEDKERAC